MAIKKPAVGDTVTVKVESPYEKVAVEETGEVIELLSTQFMYTTPAHSFKRCARYTSIVKGSTKCKS